MDYDEDYVLHPRELEYPGAAKLIKIMHNLTTILNQNNQKKLSYGEFN